MKRFVLATLVALAFPLASFADSATIYVTENEMGPFGTNTYNGGTLNWSGFFSGDNGQMNLTASKGSGPGPTFTLSVWCIDQPGFIGLGSNPSVDGTPITYTVESLSKFTTDFSGNSITHRQAREIGALASFGDLMLRTATNKAVFSNAVQAAISDIEYGSTSDGGAAVNAETATLIAWAESLTPSQLSAYHAEILVDDKDQKLVAASTVPEPGTFALFGTGLLTLAGLVRKKLKV